MKRSTKFITLLVAAFAVPGFILLEIPRKPPSPPQPIAFDHWQHVTKSEGPQLDCNFCHEHADRSAYATIPNIDTCMVCHAATETDSPEVGKVAGFAERKEQPPWARVYWIAPEGDAFFTHKPHVRAGVECAECHGDVANSHALRREVEPTMGWCIDCHQERRVSIDCYVCHR